MRDTMIILNPRAEHRAGRSLPQDQGEQDDKIIAVHADDPEFSGYNDINEIPAHRLMEIRR